MTANTTNDLWTLGFDEVGATLKSMQDAGITPELLARFRSNKAADRQWAKEMAQIMLGNDQVRGSLSTPVKKVLLQLLRTVDGFAQELFVAIDFFKEESQPDGIDFWFGKILKTNFLKGNGKIELDVPALPLNVYTLTATAEDGRILAALGGNDVAKTNFAYVAQLIKAQPKGQEGVLLTNGFSNIFYVEDANGELWAVRCSWSPGGRLWSVGAGPVLDPNEWNTDYQFFSSAVFAP